MNCIFENLLWLIKSPDNFLDLLNNCKTGKDLINIAKFSLDINQLRRLYNKTLILKESNLDLSPLININIALISNSNMKLSVSAIVGTALRYGILLNIIETDFNQISNEVFSDDSLLIGKKIDFILLAIDYRGLPLKECAGDKVLAEENVFHCVNYLESIIKSLQNKTNSKIVLQNIAPLVELPFGSIENRLPGTLNWLINNINIKLDLLLSNDIYILDIASLSYTVGLNNWNDPTIWNVAKLSFSQRYVPIYSDFICRIFAASMGKSRRCLILDLDNTIWGGVIGDDGLDGILIGNGDSTGEAFLHLQRFLIEINKRGIVLAVSSKNEDNTARMPFKLHNDMLLREENISIFQVNWNDKVGNIRLISDSLSLGLESLVFLDDNPAERMLIRQELPEVAVPELPSDPALYARTLLAAGYFESLNFTDEDRNRGIYYQNNAKRSHILNKSIDLNSYLKSLKMEILITEFDDISSTRILQLINKTNQFNLTTKRYSFSKLEEFRNNKDKYYTSQIRLKDILGDNGLISVIILEKNHDYWLIDTWLMSCRVLGRQVEFSIMNHIVSIAKGSGIKKIIGLYIPSTRNKIVKDLYNNLGFTFLSNDYQIEIWELNLDNYTNKLTSINHI